MFASRRSLSLFVLPLACSLALVACNGPRKGSSSYVDGPMVLTSADLARMERPGGPRAAAGYGVRYTRAEWDRMLGEAELVERFELEPGGGPVVIGLPMPPIPGGPGGPGGPDDPRGPDGPGVPGNPEDFGVFAFGYCPEGCTPSIGPGPDDAPGHLYCRCKGPGKDDDDGSGTIGGGTLKPLVGCALRFTSTGPRCTGSCSAGQSCRLQVGSLGTGPWRAFIVKCACR